LAKGHVSFWCLSSVNQTWQGWTLEEEIHIYTNKVANKLLLFSYVYTTHISKQTFFVFRNLNDGGVLEISGGAETGVDGQLGTVLLLCQSIYNSEYNFLPQGIKMEQFFAIT
jgi:hypothetical protein